MKADDSAEPPIKKKRGRVLFYGVSGMVILLLAAMAVPNFMKARITKCKNACINNLRQIDGAKEQWALEHKKKPGDPVIEAEVDQYIKGGRPVCPAGGKYSYNAIDIAPTCTAIEGGAAHSLSSQ